MSNRFLHDQFKMSIPCAHCDGEGEVLTHNEGHFSYGNFVLASSIDVRTGQEIKLTDQQRSLIESKGDERFAQVQSEDLEHQRETNRELQHEIKHGI